MSHDVTLEDVTLLTYDLCSWPVTDLFSPICVVSHRTCPTATRLTTLVKILRELKLWRSNKAMTVHGQVRSQVTVALSWLVESCAFGLIRRDLFSLSLMKSHLIVNLLLFVDQQHILCTLNCVCRLCQDCFFFFCHWAVVLSVTGLLFLVCHWAVVFVCHWAVVFVCHWSVVFVCHWAVVLVCDVTGLLVVCYWTVVLSVPLGCCFVCQWAVVLSVTLACCFVCDTGLLFCHWAVGLSLNCWFVCHWTVVLSVAGLSFCLLFCLLLDCCFVCCWAVVLSVAGLFCLLLSCCFVCRRDVFFLSLDCCFVCRWAVVLPVAGLLFCLLLDCCFVCCWAVSCGMFEWLHIMLFLHSLCMTKQFMKCSVFLCWQFMRK